MSLKSTNITSNSSFTTMSISTPTQIASLNTTPKKESKSKSKSIQKSTKNIANITTISGIDIDTSSTMIHIISALIGIVVFYFVPLLSNFIDKPVTAVILNIIPNDLILGFFIVESSFEPYLFVCIFTPLLNVFDNILSYILYIYVKVLPSIALWSNIVVWLIAVIISYFI